MGAETKFEINGVEYDVIKRGVAQANQVAGLGRWLAQHGTAAFNAVATADESGGNDTIQAIGSFLGALDGDSLIELYRLVFGCSKEVAMEWFDIAQLVDGAIALYENQESFRRLVSRFFSDTPSTDTMETSSTP